MQRIAGQAAGLQIGPEAQIHPRRLCVRRLVQCRIKLKNGPVRFHLRPHRVLFDFGAEAADGPDRVIDQLRPQEAVDRHIVGNDVSHAGQLADHADAHPLHVAHGHGRAAKIRDEPHKRAVAAVPGVIDAVDAHARHDVRLILTAMDALIDRIVPLDKVRPDGLLRLDEGKGQRQVVLLQRTHQIRPLRIGQQQDQNSIQLLMIILRHERLDLRPVHGCVRENELRRVPQAVQNLVYIRRLRPVDARKQRQIVLQHQSQNAEFRFFLCHVSHPFCKYSAS